MIEDAAPAIGAELRGRRVGTFGDAAAFSFQGAKLLVTGEGGMLVTNDDERLRAARMSLWDHGRDRARGFWIEQLGFKYKMSNVQAAIGLGQLERVDELIEAKRRIFGWYARRARRPARHHAEPRDRLGAQHLLDDAASASEPSRGVTATG